MEVRPVKRYRHLFFDLDHTLWDFRTNSRAVLRELHAELGLAARDIPADGLIEVFEEVNDGLWERYEAGRLDKEVLRVLRFRNTLLQFGVKDERLARELGDAYIGRSPLRSALNPGALELLTDLRPHYGIHLITNGFAEVQGLKLASSRIHHLFDVVLTSEQAGARKPAAAIFHHALRSAKAEVHESLMIGDNAQADIAGARAVGIDQVHYAPEGPRDPEATYGIAHFDELRPILL